MRYTAKVFREGGFNCWIGHEQTGESARNAYIKIQPNLDLPNERSHEIQASDRGTYSGAICPIHAVNSCQHELCPCPIGGAGWLPNWDTDAAVSAVRAACP
jgi:hypothetical protein